MLQPKRREGAVVVLFEIDFVFFLEEDAVKADEADSPDGQNDLCAASNGE